MARKLTGPQVACLHAAERETELDDSGRGYAMYHQTQVTIAKRLEAQGLVYITGVDALRPLGAVKITDAGRKALAEVRR